MNDSAPGGPKVLLVGIDGLRWAVAARRGVAPTLSRLAAAGRHHLDVERAALAGPIWTSVLTGVTVDLHGVRENFFVAHRLPDCPDLLTQVVAIDPTARTFAAAGWPALVDPYGAGPVVRHRPEDQRDGRHKVVCPDGDALGLVVADAQVRNATLAALRSAQAPDVAFAYFCAPDEALYEYGLDHAQYAAALGVVDKHLGDLLAALSARAGHGAAIGVAKGRSHSSAARSHPATRPAASSGREDWLVVVVTDHGRRDGGARRDEFPEREGVVLLWSTNGHTPRWPTRIAPEAFVDLVQSARRP